MPVASWEFYSLALMLVGIHGDEAEDEAVRKLAIATEENNRGDMLVWREVAARLAEIRAERTASGV